MEYVDLELIVKRKIYLYQIHKKLTLVKRGNFEKEILFNLRNRISFILKLWFKLKVKIYLEIIVIFLFINYDAFETAIENDASRRDEIRAFRAFISSFLILVATSITSGNLEV